MNSSPTALILAGGMGNRLAAIHPDTPKPLLPVAGQPFLYWLVSWLRSQNFSDFVFAAGHKGEQIEKWLNESSLMRGATWRFHREEKPLGTGGAVRACLSLCHENLAVINGDSLIITPLKPLFDEMVNPEITGIILGNPVEDASRYGTLQSGPDGFLTGFHDKQPGRGVISAGITFLRRVALEGFPSGVTLSMESDIMPRLISGGAKIKLREVDAATPFIDIGTPESLQTSDAFIEAHLMPIIGGVGTSKIV